MRVCPEPLFPFSRLSPRFPFLRPVFFLPLGGYRGDGADTNTTVQDTVVVQDTPGGNAPNPLIVAFGTQLGAALTPAGWWQLLCCCVCSACLITWLCFCIRHWDDVDGNGTIDRRRKNSAQVIDHAAMLLLPQQ